MNNRVLETIGQYNMLKKGDRVAVGVSGGADSVALLDFLYSIRQEYNLEIIVCHINHNLRGSESDRDAAFVQSITEKLGLTFRLLSIDATELACDVGKSVEEASREARYNFFRQEAQGGKIATAHTASDNVETVIFNLARGTGLAGLCGIPPVRGQIIRPLITCTREDIESYCEAKGLEFVHDSTNFTDDYSRNVIRHHIVPRLKEINPLAVRGAADMCARLRSDSDYLQKEAERMLGELGGQYRMNREKLLRLHAAIRQRIIMQLFRKNSVQPSARLVTLAEEIFAAGSGRLEIAAGVYIYADETYCGILASQEILPYFEYKLELPKDEKAAELYINGAKITITKRKITNSEKVNNSLLNNCLNCDKICGNVTIRQKKDGDKLVMAKRGITKSLKKLFQEEKLSQSERSSRLIFADRQGVIWVQGYGADARVAAHAGSEQIFEINIL